MFPMIESTIDEQIAALTRAIQTREREALTDDGVSWSRKNDADRLRAVLAKLEAERGANNDATLPGCPHGTSEDQGWCAQCEAGLPGPPLTADDERESKEQTHRRFYSAFHDWFMRSGCDFWSECNAPESLATIAVEISDQYAAVALSGARANLALRDAEIDRLNDVICSVGNNANATDAAKRLTQRLYRVPTQTEEAAAAVVEASDALLAQSREIANLRAIYAEVAGRDPFEATERELAAEDRAALDGDPT